MKRIILALVLVCATVSDGVAQDDLMGLGLPGPAAELLDQKFRSAVTTPIVPATDNVTDIGTAAKQMKKVHVGTNVVFGSAAGPQFPAAGVITPSTSYPTPAAGNLLTNQDYMVASGAPTANFVTFPAPTAIVGQSRRLHNLSANPVAIVPQGGAINAAAALTPYSCATLKECECRVLTTSLIGCYAR